MILRAGYLALASKLQEAAAKMSDSNKQSRLSDALNDIYRGTGEWAYLVDVFGDDKSGDLVYSCGGDLRKAPYTISGDKVTIDTAAAKDVYPLTTYHEEAVEAMEAGRRNSARDLRQLQSIHDASASLGATCGMKEAGLNPGRKKGNGGLQLVESATTLEQIVLREARADYPIKLIAPGKGSSAFYPSEVLKRDGPKVFKAGTHVYLNHPTAAEESARPEGDVANLAGVLTADAEWRESDPKGPGLFSRMKVFADHATTVEEKAPHVGMSIRASGIAESGVLREGVPVLKELTGAESVDVVTRAGAGGMILTEAAKPHNHKENEMDAAEVNKLIEAAMKPHSEKITAIESQNATLKTQNAGLLARALRGDAIVEAGRVMKDISLPEAAKQLVIDTVLREGAEVPTKDGALDAAKLKESLEHEAKRIGAVLSSVGGPRVTGMGGAPAPTIDAKEAERRAAAEKESRETNLRVFESLGMSKQAAELAVQGRVA